MMNYVENGMPRILGCPDGVASFYDNLDAADDERLHAIGVTAECTRESCTRSTCPFRMTPDGSEISSVVESQR